MGSESSLHSYPISPRVFCEGGRDAAHTMSCYAQRPASQLRCASPALYHLLLLPAVPFLGTASARDRFLAILEQTRQRYRFVVVGYVLMPEHIHLLITELEVGTPRPR